jgi:hypothetical protein
VRRPQAARYDVAGDIGQLNVVDKSIGPQPNERIGDGDAELLSEHAQGRGRFPPSPKPARGSAARSWASGGSMAAVSAKTSAPPGCKSLSVPRRPARPARPDAGEEPGLVG